jgi:hypothetical protein
MRIFTRGVAVLLTTAMLATTAMVPAASAHDTRRHHRHERGNDNTALMLGLGIAAIAGIALLANQSQASQPAYYPPQPTYYPPQQPTYYQPQPVYAPQAYGRPTCTTINELPACMDQYGNWQYVR